MVAMVVWVIFLSLFCSVLFSFSIEAHTKKKSKSVLSLIPPVFFFLEHFHPFFRCVWLLDNTDANADAIKRR